MVAGGDGGEDGAAASPKISAEVHVMVGESWEDQCV